MKRNVFFVFVLAITITMALCACSKKSDSSKNKNSNNIKMGELGEWATMPTESKDEWYYGGATVTTTAISTTTKVTTSVTAYVASAKPISTTTTNTYKENITTTLTISKNDVAKDESQTNVVTNKVADKASASSQLTTQGTTQNKQEDATNTVTTRITTNSNSSHTTEATTSSSMPKYTPNLYVETSPDILNNTSTQIQESDGEVFQASATLWFQSEESLNNVSDVFDNIDCMKLNVGEVVDYNDFLDSNSLKYDDKTEYLASVLLFESSRAAQMQINENTFPELADYYEDSSRLSRNTENLILTNNTKNALVVYVYVNRYSQSITLSWYAVKA